MLQRKKDKIKIHVTFTAIACGLLTCALIVQFCFIFLLESHRYESILNQLSSAQPFGNRAALNRTALPNMFRHQPIMHWGHVTIKPGKQGFGGAHARRGARVTN